MTSQSKIAREINLPALYAKQERIIFSPARFAFIEGSTKSGKTSGCLIWQLAQVLLARKNSVHWWVAPIYSQSKIAFDRALIDFEELIVRSNKSELWLEFDRGVRWYFKSGQNSDSLYGQEVTSAVLDEASRMGEPVWDAVRSTLSTTRGPARAIANVKGRGNWHYKFCRRAESGERNYSYGKLTAQDAVDGGVLHPAELEQAAQDLPEAVYRELYFCEPSDDAYNPFGLAELDAAFGEVDRRHPAVVYGLDLARKHDHTVLIGLSSLGHVVSLDRFQLPWAEAYEKIASVVGRRPVLVDATGIGDPIASELQKRRVNVTPYVISAGAKQNLMALLRTAFSERRLRHDSDILKTELEHFEFAYTLNGGVRYAAPAGMHDDCVDALALAYWHAVHLGLLGVATRVATPRETPYAVRSRVRAR